MTDTELNVALILNDDPIFYAEALHRFLETTTHRIECIVVLPSHPTAQMKRRYTRAAIRMVSCGFILRTYAAFYGKRLFSCFSSSWASQTSLHRCAKKHRIPLYVEADVNSPAFAARLTRHRISLALSVCSQIYRESVLSLPGLKLLNFHAGLLPGNQGRFPIYWALKNRDSKLGMTCHEIVRKIDQGPILFQTYFDPSPGPPTVESLMTQFQRRMPGYFEQAIAQIKSGTVGPFLNAGIKPFYGPIP